VILLDRDALRRPEDADAILAHEAAHVLRGDWLSLMLSRVTVALFWFNPLVWRLDREVAQQAEEAADGYAAERVEPARYAQTLLDWARQSGSFVPANAMAGSEPGLSRRVKALLDGRFRQRSSRFWSVAAMAAVAAVAAPVAALEFVPAAPEAPEPPQAPVAPRMPFAAAAVAAPITSGRTVRPGRSRCAGFLVAAPVPNAPPAGAAPAAPTPPVRLVALHPHGPQPPRTPAMPHRPQPMIDADAIAAEVEAAVAEAHKSADVIRAHAIAGSTPSNRGAGPPLRPRRPCRWRPQHASRRHRHGPRCSLDGAGSRQAAQPRISRAGDRPRRRPRRPPHP
jgi:hypothetical protein